MWHGLIALDEILASRPDLDASMWLQIYDSVELEVREDQVEEVARLGEGALTTAIRLHVPLAAESKWGDRWGSLT